MKPESDFEDEASNPRDFEAQLQAMFAEPVRYADAESFQSRILFGLRLKLWLRQGFIAMAGLIGGVYALAQFIRVPALSNAHAPTLKQAAADTDQTLRAGAAIVNVARRNANLWTSNWFDSSAHYLGVMQTPMFFWISFALCLACLALYYAYSQEERI